VSKQLWLFPRYAGYPLLRSALVPPQFLVFPHRPPRQYSVEVLEGWVHCRFVVAFKIVYPTPDNRIEHTRQVFQTLVATPVQAPLPHGVAHRFRRLIADCRAEVDKKLSPSVFRQPGPECEPQEVELLMGIVPPPVFILAVDYLRLLRMQFQPTFGKPLRYRCL